MIQSKRREYFALHLTLEHREKLKAEAQRRKMSMSALGAQFISAGLIAAGCIDLECPPPLAGTEIPLPFGTDTPPM